MVEYVFNVHQGNPKILRIMVQNHDLLD